MAARAEDPGRRLKDIYDLCEPYELLKAAVPNFSAVGWEDGVVVEHGASQDSLHRITVG